MSLARFVALKHFEIHDQQVLSVSETSSGHLGLLTRFFHHDVILHESAAAGNFA